MGEDIVGNILEQVNAPGSDVVGLLQIYQAETYDAFWQRDAEARLYCGFAKRLIGAGHPTRVYELVQDGIIYHQQNLELRYWAALALTRSGNVGKATAYADDLLGQPGLPLKLRVEVVSLKGRLKKDQYERTTDSALKRKLAAEAAALYKRAHALPEANSFPGINAATMWLLADQPETAHALAAKVVAQVTEERRAPDREHDDWLLATLGEACIILGKLDQALLWYRQAIEHAQGQTGDLVSIHRQVLLLAQVVPELEGILEAFNLGNVVVFAGHMIDHPDRLTDSNASPRFPPDPELEQVVAQAIREKLDELNATIGYASAACGSDILFGEQLRARGKERHVECHIVLPFALGGCP